MNRVGLLHPTGLIGAEIRERLGKKPFAWDEIICLTTLESERSVLTEIGGTAILVEDYAPEHLTKIDLLFCCGDRIEDTRPILAELPEGLIAVVLCPDATPDDGEPVVIGVTSDLPQTSVLLSPSPASVILSHLLGPLRALGLQSVVATVLDPVSQLGQDALDEALDQARSILQFSPQPDPSALPGQVAFNLLPSPAGDLALRELLDRLLTPDLVEAVHRVQAGVFHSTSFSVLCRFAPDPGLDAVRSALLSSAMIDEPDSPEILGPIDAAGGDNILLGPIEPSGSAGAYWIWAVADNLTHGSALNALDLAQAWIESKSPPDHSAPS